MGKKVALSYAVAFLDKWLGFRASQSDIPGFTVSIHSDGQEIFSRAYGYADKALGIPMTSDHLFSLGSQSKMLTSAAMLQLVVQGDMGLDAPIATYLPWLHHHTDSRYARLTIRHLLTHTGGVIRDGNESDYWLGTRPFPSNRQLRHIIETEPLVFKPHTSMKYSNVGFALLGCALERVSGQSYYSYIRKNILREARIAHIYPDWRPHNRSHMTTGYTVPFGKHRMAVQRDRSLKAFAPAAGSIATAGAIAQFASDLCTENRLIPDRKLLREALDNQWTVPDGYDKGYEYGLGFETLRVAGRRLSGHGGTMDGFRTATYFEPNERLVVAICANCKDAPTIAMLSGIFECLFHFIDTAGSTTPSALARFNIQLHNHLAHLQIVATKGAIVAIDPNSWEPFAWAEQLQFERNGTLRIFTPNSIHDAGERVTLENHDGGEQTVRFSGITLRESPLQFAQEETHYTLPSEDSEALFLHYLRQSHESLFMLEVLPEYKLDMTYDGSGDSLFAWLHGERIRAKLLLDETAKGLQQPPWIRGYPVRAGIRIRIYDNTTAPYMQWEREHFNRINVSLLGERIYYIHRKRLGNLQIPTGDMSICSRGPIMINHYNNNRHTSSTFFSRNDYDAGRLLAIKKSLLHLVQQGQYFEELK